MLCYVGLVHFMRASCCMSACGKSHEKHATAFMTLTHEDVGCWPVSGSRGATMAQVFVLCFVGTIRPLLVAFHPIDRVGLVVVPVSERNHCDWWFS